ncbi:ABC transporter substrate-binding protein [Enterovibrio sp. ZSDZ35]|uniref:ABC transporter substrate-binding protein n=1 Tax=Enterovibrio qingdaonensis TaxID=2899818 RepID=A0ABT5QFE9_9GAMM|nr:ABC transporter substrate-binding protein [Enterovibrio sp. ZSDZ35]MDD1779698.1 ABC transporter substrate-binding protein [Enterovibrio sp. ZSDZ35]
MMNTPIKAAALALAALLSPLSQADETRIISAGSTVTELLFELGADKDVVAIDLTSRHYLGDRDIPVLGYHRQLATEGLLALSPTHLLGSPDMGPDTTLKLLKSAGVEVKALPVGNTLEDFKQRVDAVAKITHTEEKGEEIKQNVTNQINALSAAQPADKPSVMFMMLSDGRPLTVAGAETTVNTVIELAGGVNPAAKETSSYKPLSTESIVEMQPEYILISERTLEQIGGIDAVIKQQPLLAATPAVQNGNIITISGYSILGGFGLASLDLATELNERFNAK